jgi:hypothetical protein
VEIQSFIASGNAADHGQTGGGWFVGHFIDPAFGLRHSADVEVKWGVHRAGETKSAYGANDTAKTLSILVSGRFLLEFPDTGETVRLERPGDYALWPPGCWHRWTVLEDAVILTVRWPSRPDDQKARADLPPRGR